MKLINIILLIVAFYTVPAYSANTCLDHICLGQTADELKSMHIHWDKIILPSYIERNIEILVMNNSYDEIYEKFKIKTSGYKREILPYLVVQKFDNSALGYMSDITNVCGQKTSGTIPKFIGTFKSKSGYLTTVTLDTFPVRNGVVIKVNKIVRNFMVPYPKIDATYKEKYNKLIKLLKITYPTGQDASDSIYYDRGRNPLIVYGNDDKYLTLDIEEHVSSKRDRFSSRESCQKRDKSTSLD